MITILTTGVLTDIDPAYYMDTIKKGAKELLKINNDAFIIFGKMCTGVTFYIVETAGNDIIRNADFNRMIPIVKVITKENIENAASGWYMILNFATDIWIGGTWQTGYIESQKILQFVRDNYNIEVLDADEDGVYL